jgi:hypothetical protein
MMDNLSDLMEKQLELVDSIEQDKVTIGRKEVDLNSLTDQIKNIKKIRDINSFKILLQMIPNILEKVCTKHKIPPDREISFATNSETPATISVPLTDDKNCSDSNPFNIGICQRCSVLHLRGVVEKLLAEYYSWA